MKNSLLTRAIHMMLFVGLLFGYSSAYSQSIVLETLTEPSVQCTGSSVNITWVASGLLGDFTQIDLSTNGGVSWTNKGEVAKAVTNFTVVMPGTTLLNCLVRVINTGTVDTTAPFAIADKPTFRTQMSPTNEKCVGESITFAPEIFPAGSYLYQWFKDGQPLTGQTFPTYTKNNLQAGDAGIYTLQVIGCETVTSAPASLAVNAGTTITSNPSDVSGCAGKQVTLSVVATGANLTYQWKKNGANINGATRASYTIASMNQTDAGSYTCTVTGSCGAPATSSPGVISVTGSPITGLNFTNDSTVCSGTTLRLLASGTNGEPFTFIWKKNGSLLSESGPELIINNIGKIAEGTYSVQAKNACDEIAQEKTVKISVYDSPSISRQTADTTVFRGFATRLRIITSGENLKYAWYKNGVVLPNDTMAVLAINPTQFADSGVYHCVLSNKCDTVESDPIKLSVVQPPAGPKLTLSVSSIDFGCIEKNTTKDSILVALLKNEGETQLTVSSTTINGAQKDNFLATGGGSFNLDPGATRTMTIQFKPQEKKFYTAELVITSNSTPNTETLLPLSGTSCFEEVIPVAVDFGAIDISADGKTDTIFVKNTGTKAMQVDSVLISNTSFAFKNKPTLPATIQPDASLAVLVTFNNPNPGTYTGTMSVYSSVSKYDYSMTGTINQPSGIIESAETRGFAVYPNPVTNTLTLSSKFNAHIRDAKIIDKLGNTVGFISNAELAPGATLSMQVNALPQGTYYLMIAERNENVSAIPFMIIR